MGILWQIDSYLKQLQTTSTKSVGEGGNARGKIFDPEKLNTVGSGAVSTKYNMVQVTGPGNIFQQK